MRKINKTQREECIYRCILKRVIMDIKYVIGILIALITAFNILKNHEKVKRFLDKNQWVYVLAAICFIGFAILLAYYSNLQDLTNSNVGKLESNLILFSSVKDNASLYLEIGNSGKGFIYTGPKDGPMISLFRHSNLIISKKNNQLMISTSIRSKDGLIAKIANNEWQINPEESFDRNYNKNSLEVKDKNDDVVLQIRLLSDKIQFQGKYYDEYGNSATFHEFGGYPAITIADNHTDTTGIIKPIFKYPSKTHFGETID